LLGEGIGGAVLERSECLRAPGAGRLAIVMEHFTC
jgi:hypothetical protein